MENKDQLTIDSVVHIELSIKALDIFISEFATINSIPEIVTRNKAIYTLISSRDQFVTHINLCVLAGEFHSSKFLDLVKAAIIKAEDLKRLVANLPDFTEKKYLSKFAKAVEYYDTLKVLYEYSQAKLNDVKIPFKYKIWESHQKEIATKLTEELSLPDFNNLDEIEIFFIKRYAIFRISVLLVIFENDLKCNDDHIFELYSLKKLLNSPTYESLAICKILVDKASYLLYKSLYRNDSKDLFLGENSEDKIFEYDGGSYFVSFFELTQKLWSKQNYVDNKKTLSEIINEYDKLSQPRIDKLHYAIKLIRLKLKNSLVKKDYKISLDFFLRNKIELLNKLEGESFTFNKISYISLITLIDHNILSIYLFQTKNSLELNGYKNLIRELKNLFSFYDSIKSFQEKQNRLNHIAASKLLDFLNDINKELELDVKNMDDITFIEDNINNLTVDIWCQFEWEFKNYSLPVYMDFESCYIKYTENNFSENEVSTNNSIEYRLFLDSSYLLPVDFAKNKEVLLKKQFEYQQFKMKRMIQLSETIADNAKEKVQDEVKNSIKQYISTLGIFAATMSFVLTSAKVTAEIPSLHDKIVFNVFFGATLMIFTLTLEFLVVGRDEKLNSIRRWIYALSLLFVFSLYALYFSGCFSKLNKWVKASHYFEVPVKKSNHSTPNDKSSPKDILNPKADTSAHKIKN